MRRALVLRSAFSPSAGNFWGNPRSILRDADRTFRQLEKFVDRVTDSLAVSCLCVRSFSNMSVLEKYCLFEPAKQARQSEHWHNLAHGMHAVLAIGRGW